MLQPAKDEQAPRSIWRPDFTNSRRVSDAQEPARDGVSGGHVEANLCNFAGRAGEHLEGAHTHRDGLRWACDLDGPLVHISRVVDGPTAGKEQSKNEHLISSVRP